VANYAAKYCDDAQRQQRWRTRRRELKTAVAERERERERESERAKRSFGVKESGKKTKRVRDE
jgi:hypothetical protein